MRMSENTNGRKSERDMGGREGEGEDEGKRERARERERAIYREESKRVARERPEVQQLDLQMMESENGREGGMERERENDREREKERARV